jgi:hypothetical protein
MVGLLGGIGRRRPLAVDRLDRFHRVPAVRRDNRDTILDFEDLLDPRHRFRFARVIRLQGLSLGGVQLDGREQHPVHFHIDAEPQFAHRLRPDVEARHRLAQYPPLGRVARLRIQNGRNLRSFRREFDVGDLAAVRQDHMAGLGANVGDSQARTLCRRSFQRLARNRTGDAQLFIGVGDRAGAAGHLQA